MTTPTKNSIWSETLKVSTFFTNPQKKLGLFGMLNILQDVAWNHADHLGHGYEDTLKRQMAWVLTRQKLVMEEWPKVGEQIEIRTWIRPIQEIFTYRDFEIWVGSERRGMCVTSFVPLDLSTRRPKKLDPKENVAFKTEGHVPLVTSKIEVEKTLDKLSEFRVRNSDLDLNGHVNNTKYAQWVLDSIPEESPRQFSLKSYEVNFLQETISQDEIAVHGGLVSPESDDLKMFQFQGIRLSDKKVVFVSQLEAVEV